jgi:membrane dipeptidase
MSTPVFDGHNDALGRLQEEGAPAQGFLTGLPQRHVDLPRARAGGLAGGLFAINPPSPHGAASTAGGGVWSMEPAGPLDPAQATAFTAGALGRAHALVRGGDGAVAIATTVADLDRCRADGTLAMVLHIEGAEPIDTGLMALEAWRAAGVRSLGLVWSRPNAFGHGVPFRFPSSPDTGPGLTAAGRALVRRCAELRIALDVSHLNAAGFADVARLAVAPLIASHSACHALCPASRNLTDEQLQAIAASDGLVGIVFATPFLRADGEDDADMPLDTLVAHVRHAVDVMGIEHVGLGSDFDGATMPAAIGDVAGLPRLLDALAEGGFDAGEIERLAWANWRRVLALAWGS